MRKSVISILTIAAVAAAPAFAAGSPKEERIGVGTGALIGAIAGGPAGLVVGAAIGAKVGDTMNRKNVEIDTLSSSLRVSESRTAALRTDIGTLEAELLRLNSMTRPEPAALLQAGIAMDLLFRTDEYTLTDTTGGRLERLAGMLAGMPGIRIRLDGYADERGATDYNFELSQKRVDSVREQLVAAGIDPHRIQARAFGESPAPDASKDSLALERRVNMTVFIDEEPALAANPE